MALSITPLLIILTASLEPATQVRQSAPASPTSSTAEQKGESFESLDSDSSISFRNDGGPAALKSLSIRGSTSKEVGVFFEGIRLNSFASGEFDLGLISPFGLSKAQIIKGGHHGYSASPHGALFLGLPETEETESKFLWGDYSTLGFFQRVPGASLSIDQSDNDYPYSINGQKLRRAHNSHQRINFRVWKRWESSQIWGQVLTNDLELPGPVTANFAPSRSLTVRPMVAAQYRWDRSEANIFANYQRQSVDGSDNHYWGGMGRLSRRMSFSKSTALELGIEESLDFLSTPYFDSPLRSMSLATLSLLWSPWDEILINPQIQGDAVSDLDGKFGISGGLGVRWSLLHSFSLKTHLNYVTRIPNFNEMYFEIPPSFLSNENLEREPSLQFDFGYDFHWKQIKLSQSVFWIRTNKTISSVYSNGTYQAQNLGAGARLGLESDLQVTIARNFELNFSYQLLKTGLLNTRKGLFEFDVIEAADRQLYQPTHKISFEPKFIADRSIELSIPFYFRSEVRASLNNEKIPRQFDLGLVISSKPVNYFPFSLEFKVENLLAKNREETYGYPLGSEPRVQLSLEHRWN